MKKIGHIDGAMDTPAVWRTHSLGMLSPHDLYIPNPGERENVDADRWHLVGWINPDSDGGVLCGNHATAGEHGRPAYIERIEPVPVFQDKPSTFDPMNIRRSEFEALAERVRKIERRLFPVEPALDANMSVISTTDLLSEVSAFCNDELDQFTGPEFDSDAEVGCQRANVYLREMVHRLETYRKADKLTMGQTYGTIQTPLGPPMTFYDHAFIAAYIAANETMNRDMATKDAHDTAAHLTRNRTP